MGAVGVTVAAAWIAARVAARRAIGIRPTEALAEAATEPTGISAIRLLAGVGLIAGAAVLTVVLSGLTAQPAAAPVTLLTALMWATAAALLGPLLVRPAAGILSVPLRGASRAADIGRLLAEGGTTIHTRLLAEGLVDELHLVVGRGRPGGTSSPQGERLPAHDRARWAASAASGGVVG